MEPKKKLSPLAEVERRVLAEGQEWMRQRMAQELQALADAEGGLSPLGRPDADPPQAPDHSAADRRRPRRH
jgi:hypothetical protein